MPNDHTGAMVAKFLDIDSIFKKSMQIIRIGSILA
jgi:hypothetical protein